MLTIGTRRERDLSFGVIAFQIRRQEESHCSLVEWGDRVMATALSGGCGYDCGVNGYAHAHARVHGPNVIPTANANVKCRLIVQTSVASGYLLGIVVLGCESANANEGVHVHDCVHGSWQRLAERKKMPYSGMTVYDRALKPVRCCAPPHVRLWTPQTRNLWCRSGNCLAC